MLVSTYEAVVPEGEVLDAVTLEQFPVGTHDGEHTHKLAQAASYGQVFGLAECSA